MTQSSPESSTAATSAGSPHWPWHAQPWDLLQDAIRRDRLTHALLLAGPAGLGKADFAHRFAAARLCREPDPDGDACGKCPACHQVRAGTHPDLHWIAPEAPGKAIRVDAIRRLRDRSTLAAQGGRTRVFVIMPADALNPAAGNALLKTLEEPVGDALFLLVSERPDRIAATLRSRCQRVRFKPPTSIDLTSILGDPGTGDRYDALQAISGGLPLKARRAREEDWLAQADTVMVGLEALAQRKTSPHEAVEKWGQWPLTAVTATLQRITYDLARLGAGSGDRLYHPGYRARLQSLSDVIDLPKTFDLLDRLAQTERELTHNLNPTMVLEGLVNTWLDMTRTGGR